MSLVKCSGCGGDVSTDAAACPKCGKPPKKSMGIVKFVVLGMVGLFVMCCVLSNIVNSSARNGQGTTRTTDSAPPQAAVKDEQLPWVETVASNCAAYKAAPNEIKKSAIFNQNTTLVSKTKVANVKGTLTRLATTQGGEELSLRIKVGSVEFHTESLFGPIKKGSAVYAAASELAERQCVVFSASSLKPSSLVEQSQVCDPEYFAVFTNIAPCQ